eukprot:gene31458-40857_t
MKMLLCLHFLISASLFTSAAFSIGRQGRSLDDIQNPMKYPGECGRSKVEHSSICDPDSFLSKDNGDIIEGYINAITSAQIGVAVIKKMNMKQYRTKNVDVAAQSFAVDLHDKWGVGGVDGKENGIFVFLSIEDRVVYISTGRDVKKIVTQRDIEVLIAAVKPDLKRKDYGTAIQNIVLRIDMLLNPHSEVRKSYGQGGIVKKPDMLAAVFFGGVIVFFMSLYHCVSSPSSRLEKGTARLEAMMRDIDKSVSENKYVTSSCPICLEDYIVEDSSPRRQMALVTCGHTFCHACLMQLFQQSNCRCPICRVEIEGNSDNASSAEPHNHPAESSSTQSNFWNAAAGRGADPRTMQQERRMHSFARSFFNPSTFGSFTSQAPEIRYRMDRMRELYPDAMSPEVFTSMSEAIDRNSYAEFNHRISTRAAHLRESLRVVRASTSSGARRSGRSGAKKSSFGGGSSRGGGGGGGRW